MTAVVLHLTLRFGPEIADRPRLVPRIWGASASGGVEYDGSGTGTELFAAARTLSLSKKLPFADTPKKVS